MGIQSQVASAHRSVSRRPFLRRVLDRWTRTWPYATGVFALATLSGDGVSIRLLAGTAAVTLALALLGALATSRKRGRGEIDRPPLRARVRSVRGWRAAFDIADDPTWRRYPRRTRNAVAFVVLLIGMAPVVLAGLTSSFSFGTLLFFSAPPVMVWVVLTEWRSDDR